MGMVKATEEAIRAGGELLREGRLVAFPTETVYGLGADACNGRAVAAIFAAKGRPRFNPLIVHVPDVAQAEEHAALTPLARTLANAFWPGPLTLVLERRPQSTLSELVTAGLPSVALRFILAHPAVTTVIPGMRALANVEANLAVSGKPLPPAQVAALRAFRWDRKPDHRP